VSGLLGVWNLDGEPVARETLAAMAANIAHRGGDGLDFWIEGPAGLACHLWRITPESSFEHQPLADTHGHVLLFDGRIDNRADLIATFEPADGGEQLSDADLVLMAYRRWGRKAMAHLVGDFAIAIYVAKEQRLVLARDVVGCRPLYYWRNDRRFIFASEVKALLAHPDVQAAPNLDLLADTLLLDQLPYEDDGDTFFEDVHRVLPAHTLLVKPKAIEANRFWDFDPTATVRHRAYSDYVLSLRELLTRATRRRMRTSHPIAIGVSGGLDSAIVLSIANQVARKASPSPVLVPISYSPVTDGKSQENEFIRLIEAYCEREVKRLDMGAPGDPRWMSEAAWHSETPCIDDSWCAEAPLMEYARSQGGRVLLSGLWSDQYMFATGYLVDLLKRFAWRRAFRHLREYSNWFPDTEPSYFRGRLFQEMALNLTPRMLRSLLRPLNSWRAGWHKNRSWVSRELVKRARRGRPRLKHPHYASVHARNIYQTVHAKSHHLTIDSDGLMASRFGLERAMPFLDRDVIAFLMAIPGDIQMRGGVPRGLLRDAVRGLVPQAIRRRRWRDEGTTSTQLEDTRSAVYRSSSLDSFESRVLGFTPGDHLSNDQYLEALGLEYWVRVFLGRRASRDNPNAFGIKEAV